MPGAAPSPLHAGFAYYAETTPDNPALILGGRVYTYSELAGITRDWAWRLIERAGGRPRRVGVFASRNEVFYAGVLASLFAGAAFVPLNPKFPLERTRAMLQAADVDALIASSETLGQLGILLKHVPRMPVLLLPDTPPAALGHCIVHSNLYL